MTAPSKPIRLIDPLPCATMADTPTGICGRPAYAAHAWQQERIDLDWNPPGLWTLQPVCETCAHAAAELYQVTPTLEELADGDAYHARLVALSEGAP